METKTTHQHFHVPFPRLDAVQDEVATLVEASNSCSEAELQVVFSSSCHTIIYALILVYTARRVRSVK